MKANVLLVDSGEYGLSAVIARQDLAVPASLQSSASETAWPRKWLLAKRKRMLDGSKPLT
jgi:hypothetical protein